MKKVFTLFVLQLLVAVAFAQNFTVGQKVEAWTSGEWYAGTISQIGSDNYQGYYYVKWEKYSSGQWVKASNIRSSKPAADNATVSPRNGSYVILSYGGSNMPIRLGYFDLKDGQYTYYNLAKKSLGQGQYSYDVKSKSITWQNGPFKDANWNGAFEIDREGKTHKIRLTRTTIGSNSTDAN